MSYKRVAITGFGIISPLGRGTEKNISSLKEGKSGIVSQKPEWEENKFRSLVAGNILVEDYKKLFDRKQCRFLCDAALLSATAMLDAIESAGLTELEVQDPHTGIIMGSGAGSSISDAVALGDKLRKRGGAKVGAFQVPLIMGSSITANIGSIFHIHGHSYSISSACTTSAHSLMMGLDLIRSGRQKIVFAGGAEDVNIFSACAFDGMGALSSAFNNDPTRASRPLDRDRDGFVFSGGSGVLVLEELETAIKRGAKIHAIFQGAGATCDGTNMVAPSGEGAVRAMETAIKDASLNREDIDYINLHGTSTPVGDLKETEAIRTVFKDSIPPFSSTKSMTGHGLGAAGAQEAIFSILMLNEKFLAPNINLENPDPKMVDLPIVKETRDFSSNHILSNSFGFGGTNCSLIFSKYNSEK